MTEPETPPEEASPEGGAPKPEKDDLVGRAVKHVGRIAKKPFTAGARFAFDEYIDGKLDEIEERIDRKLEEIDRKMDAWRTREVRHRLRILKYTIIATVVVAALSILYTLFIR